MSILQAKQLALLIEVEAAQPGYGVDLNSSQPPLDEVADHPQQADYEEMDPNHEREADICIREALKNFDFKKEDDNYGIKVYFPLMAVNAIFPGKSITANCSNEGADREIAVLGIF
ncbi:hypothetical protein K438DRAFT_1761164 [Mycena galopus ATCC 62051]|nr:hypothetical protein K438DRAFT_1761164 [Mycena galopus ATCC 62051]